VCKVVVVMAMGLKDRITDGGGAGVACTDAVQILQIATHVQQRELQHGQRHLLQKSAKRGWEKARKKGGGGRGRSAL
jgi:hypothetical protein